MTILANDFDSTFVPYCLSSQIELSWAEADNAGGKGYTEITETCLLTPSTNPLLNFLNGGLMTLLLLITHWRPILTFARSPRRIQSD